MNHNNAIPTTPNRYHDLGVALSCVDAAARSTARFDFLGFAFIGSWQYRNQSSVATVARRVELCELATAASALSINNFRVVDEVTSPFDPLYV